MNSAINSGEWFISCRLRRLLHDKRAKENGQNVDAFVKKYEHRNVYFYNDGCIKKILASEKNLMLTTDFVNAALPYGSVPSTH